MFIGCCSSCPGAGAAGKDQCPGFLVPSPHWAGQKEDMKAESFATWARHGLWGLPASPLEWAPALMGTLHRTKSTGPHIFTSCNLRCCAVGRNGFERFLPEGIWLVHVSLVEHQSCATVHSKCLKVARGPRGLWDFNRSRPWRLKGPLRSFRVHYLQNFAEKKGWVLDLKKKKQFPGLSEFLARRGLSMRKYPRWVLSSASSGNTDVLPGYTWVDPWRVSFLNIYPIAISYYTNHRSPCTATS